MQYFQQLLPVQYDQLAHNENVLRFPLINSVFLGKQSGNIFACDADSFLIQHKAGFSLLAISFRSTIKDTLIDLFNKEGIPEYFHIYDPEPWLVDTLIEMVDQFNVRIRNRVQLRSNSLEEFPLDAEIPHLPSGLIVETIDETNFKKLDDLDLKIEAKFWDSKEHFMEKGFGVCLIDKVSNKAIAACYSAVVVDNVAEIDIKTSADRMNSGFGSLVASEFLKMSAKKGVIANWDCFTENFGSLALAKKIGLKEIFSYQFISVFNKKNNYEYSGNK